nr:hypothetical protein [Desulfobacterales bacterium]
MAHLLCASHSIRSIAYVMETANELRVPQHIWSTKSFTGCPNRFETPCEKVGLHLRLYTPIGKMIPRMAYLVRRLLENTSNESFLRQRFAEGVCIWRQRPLPKRASVGLDGFRALETFHRGLR